MPKHTNAYKKRKRSLDTQVNRLAKQSGMSKQAVLEDLAIKIGHNGIVTAPELANNGGAKLTRLLKSGLKVEEDGITTATERKNTTQYQNKLLRQITKIGNASDLQPTWNKNKLKKAKDMGLSDKMINEMIELDLSVIKEGAQEKKEQSKMSMPSTMQQAVQDPRWGTNNKEFDKYVLYNLLSGDVFELIMLAYGDATSDNIVYAYSL